MHFDSKKSKKNHAANYDKNAFEHHLENNKNLYIFELNYSLFNDSLSFLFIQNVKIEKTIIFSRDTQMYSAFHTIKVCFWGTAL